MTPEEKDLIKQIRAQDIDLKTREKAMKRLGEIMEESFILDLLQSQAVIRALEQIAVSKNAPPSLKRKAKAFLKAYQV